MELGLTTFAERTPNPDTGHLISPHERYRHLLEEAQVADEVGLDVFGIGEHHRGDFIASAPVVPLAAIAARTERLRLTSAVTVLSSDDPVRVFQAFSSLDLVSDGRAEIIAGRGSFTESFPLFGYDLHDYDALFEEKLDLLLRLRESERVSWSGRHRPELQDADVHPRPLQDPLPVWIGVGGTPSSAARAGRLGLPMILGIIGGLPERFRPFKDVHAESARRAGFAPPALALNSHGFLARDAQEARDAYYPSYSAAMNAIGRERGWPGMTREQFDAACDRRGALFVGTPDEVTEKILFQYDLFGHGRFLLQIGVGSLPHERVLESIRLFGEEVAPRVREEVAKRGVTAS